MHEYDVIYDTVSATVQSSVISLRDHSSLIPLPLPVSALLVYPPDAPLIHPRPTRTAAPVLLHHHHLSMSHTRVDCNDSVSTLVYSASYSTYAVLSRCEHRHIHHRCIGRWSVRRVSLDTQRTGSHHRTRTTADASPCRRPTMRK